jgi:endonuclease/exonuclease/phosphatase family metal-dependent hydrolase
VPTVATFNIRHGVGLDGAMDLTRTAAAMAETGADLIALQELDRGLERSGRADQPRVLADLTGMRVHFFPTLTRGGGGYGLALAARDAVDGRLEDLPRIEEEPRGAIVARWRGLTVVATHLSRLKDDPEGVQARSVAALASREEAPALVLGDFNRPPSRLEALAAAGFHPVGAGAPTFGKLWRRRQVDHVLLGAGIRGLRGWTVASRASDHLPFVARIERLRRS